MDEVLKNTQMTNSKKYLSNVQERLDCIGRVIDSENNAYSNTRYCFDFTSRESHHFHRLTITGDEFVIQFLERGETTSEQKYVGEDEFVYRMVRRRLRVIANVSTHGRGPMTEAIRREQLNLELSLLRKIDTTWAVEFEKDIENSVARYPYPNKGRNKQ